MQPISDRRSFLTARWVNLILLTYAVDRDLLTPLLPPQCALDLRDGRAFVSLVAFDFLDTRVFGISWPGFRQFPEINLRFYVRHGTDRGVCFIQELVPQRFVAFMARAFYNEPYRSAAMVGKTVVQNDKVTVEHCVTQSGRTSRLNLCGSMPAIRPASDSIEHFLMEHSWGFGRSRRGRLLQYRVHHPEWDIWPVESWNLDWDWSAIYGDRWSLLQKAEPISIIFAAGSEVQVYPKTPD
jgi:uncharacterized protein YqjF (DUF2071 family)